MIKVNYNTETGEILGYYPDFIGYSNIPSPTIEIDAATHQDCIQNSGLRRVDLTSFQIIEYTPPEPETQIITPEVDQEKADLWEAILALTEKIETLEGGNS